MIIEIESCNDCPCLIPDYGSCGATEEDLKYDWDVDRQLPTNCPLRNEEIVIKLKV